MLKFMVYGSLYHISFFNSTDAARVLKKTYFSGGLQLDI